MTGGWVAAGYRPQTTGGMRLHRLALPACFCSFQKFAGQAIGACDDDCVLVATCRGDREMASWSVCVDVLGFATRRFLESKLPAGDKHISGNISKLHDNIMSEEEMEHLGILPEATMFAFAYPVAKLEGLDWVVSGGLPGL